MDKVGFSFGPEVPVDGGGAVHLAPPLAGDAAQFEVLARHRLRVGVHLGTGPVTLVHFVLQKKKTEKRETDVSIELWDYTRYRETKTRRMLLNSPNSVQSRAGSSRCDAAMSKGVLFCSRWMRRILKKYQGS